MLVTDVQCQAQQLVGTFYGFGLDNQRHTQVHRSERVELDFRRQRVLGQLTVTGRCRFARVGLAGDQVFFRSIGHGLDFHRVNTGHQRLELVQLMVVEQGGVVIPGQRRDVKERFRVGGQQRQHWLEEDHQLTEQVDARGADRLDLRLLAFLLVQRPRCLVGDPGVGAVCQAHDFTHGACKVARLVGIGDAWRSGQERVGQFRRGIFGHQQAGVTLVDKPGATAGDVNDFTHQVRVDLLYEVFQVQVQVIDATAQLGGVVVAQVFRRQVVQVGARLDKGATGLGHFLAVDGQVAVHCDAGRLAVARAFEHRRPEQGVEVDDVLADEVVQLGGGILVPERIEVQLRRAIAQVLEAGHVADWRIQPHIEILARFARNLEAEVRRIAGDVPLLQAAVEPFGELVGHGVLQGAAAGPGLQHLLEVRQLEEEVLGILEHRGSAGDRRLRILQLSRRVGCTAFFAVVAVLVFGAAFGAGALDEAVGQEHFLFRVEILGHRTLVDVPSFL